MISFSPFLYALLFYSMSWSYNCATFLVKTPSTLFIQQSVKIIGKFWNLQCILQWSQHFLIDHNLASYFQNCTIQKPAYRKTFQLFNDTKHIWALARAPDLHLNIHQLVTSSNNTTQHIIKVTHLPDELSARALKQRYMECYGTRLSTRRPKNGKTWPF